MDQAIVASSSVLDVMTFEDIARALTEFRPVLKPTGRTVLVNLTKIDPAWMTWYERYYKALHSSAKASVGRMSALSAFSTSSPPRDSLRHDACWCTRRCRRESPAGYE